MKRFILLTVAAALFAFNGYAQDKNDVNIIDYTLELKENGYLAFRLKEENKTFD
jgi:hypothetical protein